MARTQTRQPAGTTPGPQRRQQNSNSSHAAAPRRVYLAGVDPVVLYELLETHFEDPGGAGGSAYRQLYRTTFRAALESDGPPAVHFAALLDEIDVANLVEDAMRRAGFVVGFECCPAVVARRRRPRVVGGSGEAWRRRCGMNRAARKRALQRGDVATLVSDAGALAREILLSGGVGGQIADGDLYALIESHVAVGPIEIHDDAFPPVVDLAIGSYAIGIAVGLLLRPQAFTRGAVRAIGGSR